MIKASKPYFSFQTTNLLLGFGQVTLLFRTSKMPILLTACLTLFFL